MPTSGIHRRLTADEGQVDGDESDENVIDGIETILEQFKEFRHFAQIEEEQSKLPTNKTL